MIEFEYPVQGYAKGYADLLEMALNLPTAHKKHLAEYLLDALEEEGYECKWESFVLTARKVEEL